MAQFKRLVIHRDVKVIKKRESLNIEYDKEKK